MDDDGFVLFESNAIVKYLAQKNQSSLYPQVIKKRAKIDQWMDFISIHIRGAFVRVFWNTVGVRFMGEEPDQNSLHTGLKFLDSYLPVVDNQLSKSRYLAGDELTLADFCLLAELDGAEMMQLDLSNYSHLTKWRDDLKKQKFYQVDRSFGEAAVAERLAQQTA